MTKKRFVAIGVEWTDGFIQDHIDDRDLFNIGAVCNLLNELSDENEQLKKELRVYRNLARCSNCKYHNYDWFDDGDEFEVCDKGNDVTEGICEDWEEF